MKRVAVLGCSHSAYDQVNFGDHANGLDWVHHMAEDNSDIEFHNYGAQGHGPLYYDFILKYIISNFPKDYYDAVIIQYTVEGRWLIPIGILNYEITSQQVTENYIVKRLHSTRVVVTSGNFHTTPYIEDKNIKKQIDRASTTLEKYKDKNGLPVMYENAFIDTLDKIYKPHFKNLFYFDFLNGYSEEISNTDHKKRSNIGAKLPFIKWALSKYGEEYVLMELLDDSLHCSPEGNYVLYYNYIRNSKIGRYLKK